MKATALRNGDRVDLVGVVAGDPDVWKNRAGQQAATVQLHCDDGGDVEVTVFPEQYRDARALLARGARIRVTGRVDVYDDTPPQVIALHGGVTAADRKADR